MKSADLSREQAERLGATVARDLRYLNRLLARMQRLSFPVSDPLWNSTVRARNAMQDLHAVCHYAGCGHGVGSAAARDT